MKVPFGTRELELDGPCLGRLRDSSHLRDDPESLRAHLQEDGYLFIRGLHDPEKVKAARRVILANLDTNRQIDRQYPLEEAIAAPGASGAFLGGHKEITHTPEFLSLVEAPELMEFFTRFLGSPAMTYDYKWLRVVGTGGYTGVHLDIPYMGRGTQHVYTLWTPLGDVSYEMGPLAILSRPDKQENFEKLKATYGQMDVDRDHVTGWFSDDPVEIVELFGGRWHTAEFEMGDALIFGMFTLHASLNNTTHRYRLSCDTRYQRADEPVDERWIGEEPLSHYAWGKGETVPMEEARKKWGI